MVKLNVENKHSTTLTWSCDVSSWIHLQHERQSSSLHFARIMHFTQQRAYTWIKSRGSLMDFNGALATFLSTSTSDPENQPLWRNKEQRTGLVGVIPACLSPRCAFDVVQRRQTLFLSYTQRPKCKTWTRTGASMNICSTKTFYMEPNEFCFNLKQVKLHSNDLHIAHMQNLIIK